MQSFSTFFKQHAEQKYLRFRSSGDFLRRHQSLL